MSEPRPNHQAGERRGAFRLRELIVVVAIILLMLVFTLPAIQAARETARRNQCNNNLKVISLGLQTYADINKYFPYDALWGQYPRNSIANASTKQGAYHHSWIVSILPQITSGPTDNVINKRTALWNQSQQYGTGRVRKVAPPAYFGYIQSQRIPPFHCPSEMAFNGADGLPTLDALPGFCMWSNYAGIAPLYNALYMPNSNWPGSDSNHPGVVLVVFADGHSGIIRNDIAFAVWASLHTRTGGEPINGDY